MLKRCVVMMFCVTILFGCYEDPKDERTLEKPVYINYADTRLDISVALDRFNIKTKVYLGVATITNKINEEISIFPLSDIFLVSNEIEYPMWADHPVISSISFVVPSQKTVNEKIFFDKVPEGIDWEKAKLKVKLGEPVKRGEDSVMQQTKRRN